MPSLINTLNERLSGGLARKSISRCSEYAIAYRRMGKPFPGPYSFKHHPWCREMHDCHADLMVGQKGAQLGYTEVALNKTFYANDILGESVLYVLPNDTPDAGNFSSARFDPALELSTHLDSFYESVRNVGHKRAGSSNLYITGSKSRARLKSVPTGVVIADEVEEMDQNNIALIPERMSGQMDKHFFMLSTPSLPGMGINKYYLASTERHYMFKCPHCSRATELVFPDCLVITAEDINDAGIKNSHLICKECNHILDHSTKALWLNEDNAYWHPTHKNRISEGYHISQLYSFTVKPYELAINYLKGLSDPSSEQEFYNSKLGVPHEVEGARVTEEVLNDCIGTTTMGDRNGLKTIGIDVGSDLHFWVDQWFFDQKANTNDIHLKAVARNLFHGKVKHFADVDGLINKFRPASVVIDKNPESRATLELAERWPNLVRRCEYNQGERGTRIREKDEAVISVDRTSFLDLSLGRFHNKTIRMPKNMTQECRTHLKSLVRTYSKDKDGNPVGKYVKSDNDQDHLAHARNYSEIALAFANIGTGVSDIRGEI